MPDKRTPALRQLAEVIHHQDVDLDPRTVADIILEIAGENCDIAEWVRQLAIDVMANLQPLEQ
jgi:hypothetical protein